MVIAAANLYPVFSFVPAASFDPIFLILSRRASIYAANTEQTKDNTSISLRLACFVGKKLETKTPQGRRPHCDKCVFAGEVLFVDRQFTYIDGNIKTSLNVCFKIRVRFNYTLGSHPNPSILTEKIRSSGLLKTLSGSTLDFMTPHPPGWFHDLLLSLMWITLLPICVVWLSHSIMKSVSNPSMWLRSLLFWWCVFLRVETVVEPTNELNQTLESFYEGKGSNNHHKNCNKPIESVLLANLGWSQWNWYEFIPLGQSVVAWPHRPWVERPVDVCCFMTSQLQLLL